MQQPQSQPRASAQQPQAGPYAQFGQTAPAQYQQPPQKSQLTSQYKASQGKQMHASQPP